MKTFILILTIFRYDLAAIQTQEFSSQESCLTAKHQWEKNNYYYQKRIFSAVCVAK